MPYLINTPRSRTPYVLDDEDSHFLAYFQTWGWQTSQRYPASDPQVQNLSARERKRRRPTLFEVWQAEYSARNQASEKVKSAQRGCSGKTKEKTSLARKVSMFFGKCEGKKAAEPMPYEAPGEKPNYLEDLQKGWTYEVESKREKTKTGPDRFSSRT